MVFSLSESRTGVPVGKVDAVAGRWLLWVDGVGGFMLLPGDDWTIGGPSGSEDSEICIQGDLSRREACIRRQGSDYILQPLGTVLLGGRRLSRPTELRDGDLITLGSSAVDTGAMRPLRPLESSPLRGARLEFSRPHPLSASARLRLDSRHKTRPRADGIILLADTCVIGPTRGSHIVTPEADCEVVLVQRGDQWFCRSESGTEVAGEMRKGRVAIPLGMRIESGGLSFTLEAITA